MNGEGGGAAWEDEYETGEDGADETGRNSAAGADDEKTSTAAEQEGGGSGMKGRSREGKWESGQGRCPITGRRVLGGTEGLRRVLV